MEQLISRVENLIQLQMKLKEEKDVELLNEVKNMEGKIDDGTFFAEVTFDVTKSFISSVNRFLGGGEILTDGIPFEVLMVVPSLSAEIWEKVSKEHKDKATRDFLSYVRNSSFSLEHFYLIFKKEYGSYKNRISYAIEGKGDNVISKEKEDETFSLYKEIFFSLSCFDETNSLSFIQNCLSIINEKSIGFHVTLSFLRTFSTHFANDESRKFLHEWYQNERVEFLNKALKHDLNDYFLLHYLLNKEQEEHLISEYSLYFEHHITKMEQDMKKHSFYDESRLSSMQVIKRHLTEFSKW